MGARQIVEVARALVTDVRAYRKGRAVSVTPPSPLERARGWSRRRPGLTALAFATVASLTFVTIFVGAQVWVDMELAGKALASIAAGDAYVAEIDQQLRAAARDPDVNGPSLQALRRELGARRLVRQLESTVLLVSVTRLRFIRTSDEIQILARARLFETITTSLETGEPGFAKALAALAIERAQNSAAALEFSSAEVERLRALVAEADAAMIRRTATFAPATGGAEPE